MILGIESTAHTFGIGVVDKGKILANAKDVYTTKDGEGGMIPIEVGKHHSAVKHKVLQDALHEAGIILGDVKAIAFSQGPGLAPCLLEGLKFAKELADKINVPLIPVNHCIAHLEIGKITGAKDPVMLYASGANTQIIAFAAGKYRIFGETLDTGVGNFIDTFARYAGLGFPGGPKIAELAQQCKEEDYIPLSYTVKGMDMAFSGILTQLRNKLEKQKQPLNKLAYSMQETVFAMLVEATERALAHTGKKELVLGGGVACNKRLQEMCRIMAQERGAKFFCPENKLLVDNAAMIAYTGEIMMKAEKCKIMEKQAKMELDMKPRQRTDDVDVCWQ